MVDCGPDNAAKIMTRVNSITPTGATPICTGLKSFLPSVSPKYAPVFTSKDATRYLLLISDGADTCGGTRGECRPKSIFSANRPTTAQLGDMTARLANEGINTFVIGFGKDVDASELNAIAAAGNTPFKKYLIANDTKSLQDAFEQIAASMVSCVFTLDPEDPTQVDFSEINFYFDGQAVPYEQTCAAGQSWRWVDETQKTTVEFCPGACDRLKNGEIDEVSATFGCPTISPI
jgi:hypothetical protein